MARKTASRLTKRREVEAAEAAEAAEPTATKKKAKKKKKAAKKRKTTRSRAKKDVLERRRIVWAIYGSTMKEEARFPYEELKEAEAKLEQLRSKSKKSYFIQRLKEPIVKEDEPEEAAGDGEEAAAAKKKTTKKKAAAKKKS